jgi:hypothetical protein
VGKNPVLLVLTLQQQQNRNQKNPAKVGCQGPCRRRRVVLLDGVVASTLRKGRRNGRGSRGENGIERKGTKVKLIGVTVGLGHWASLVAYWRTNQLPLRRWQFMLSVSFILTDFVQLGINSITTLFVVANAANSRLNKVQASTKRLVIRTPFMKQPLHWHQHSESIFSQTITRLPRSPL